jgi:Carbohydrate family 9 binding domain-like
MKRFAGTAFLLALTAGLSMGPDQIESKHAERDASADTDPNSGFWRGVAPIFAERDGSALLVPGHRTEIRSRWTDRNLYFLFICPYEQLNLKPEPKTETETNELWKWDVAEVFIGSDFKNIRRYKEFEISPQGEWIDLDIDLDAPRHEDGWVWNSGFQASARIDQATKIWYGFMRIPYAAVDARSAAAGNTLRVNFFRSQGARPNHKAIVWQPTHRPTFHVPEVFGTLRLVD